MGDFNGDSRRNIYTQDRIFKKWLLESKKIELTRLFVQPIPYTFLSPTGSVSTIDHILINDDQDWSEIKEVNILCSEIEYGRLRDGQDWSNTIKGVWDWENNHGDHRPLTVSLEVSVIISKLSDIISSKKRTNWNVTANQIRYAEIVRDLIIKSDFKSIENSNLNENECARDFELLADRMLSAEKIFLGNLKINKNRKNKHEKSKRFWCELLKTLVYWRNKAHRAHKALAHSSFKAVHSNLNKKIKQIIKKRRKYFIWLDRQDLIKKFLKHPNLFWKDINEKRGAKVKIDIDPSFLK